LAQKVSSAVDSMDCCA